MFEGKYIVHHRHICIFELRQLKTHLSITVTQSTQQVCHSTTKFDILHDIDKNLIRENNCNYLYIYLFHSKNKKTSNDTKPRTNNTTSQL